MEASAFAVKLDITGVKSNVQQNIQTRLSELYRNESIAQDPEEAVRKQIEKAMYPYGYFAPRIRVLARSHQYLRVHINPGPKMRITSLSIQVTGEGANNPELLKALQDLPIKQGQLFLSPKYDEAKESLLSAAEHEGYLHATFEQSEVLIDRKQYTTHITLVFNTGPQFYFGQVKFDPTYVSPELLRRYLPFQPGQPYSTEQLLTLESTLSASGYFRSVVVKPQIDSDRTVPIDVHLERVHRINYTLGVGYGTDTGPRGRAALHVVPVNRAGHKFNAIAQGSFNENALLAQYVIPGKNPITDNYNITGSVSNLDYSSGYSNSFLFSLAHQHIKKNHQRVLSLNALSERFNYTGFPKTTKSLFYPKAVLTWSHTTDPLFTPTGYNITLNGFIAPSIGQATIDAKGALTIDVIRTRLYLHGIQGITGINNIYELPVSLAMLLGGAENLKGYGFNSIGPGKIMTYGGVEVQKEFIDKWYLIGFYDVGDVYKPTPQAMQYDAGPALMWVSPIGPIKVGVAFPMTNRFKRVPGRDPKLVINMGPDI
ncbi:autotransporter assembly complex protein TamA [Legionella yabuuchiae]|uniref:autotransporter assembly complex protein TamA n=1 Tax=Legionella yabuuchiae TaxID=376727 RepID=UPI001F5F2561|nr:POTRA domain-containing protein [Legionella yabuuchiae]